MNADKPASWILPLTNAVDQVTAAPKQKLFSILEDSVLNYMWKLVWAQVTKYSEIIL